MTKNDRLHTYFLESTAVPCSVPSEVRNCAEPPEHLRSAISFSRTCNISYLISHIYHSPSTTWHGCAIACSLKQNLFSVKFSWRVHWCRANKGKRGQGSKKPHIFGRVLQPLRKTFLMEIFQGFFPSATYLRLPLITVLDFWCKRSFMHSIWQGFYGVGKVWKNVLSFSSLGKSGKKFMVRWFFIIFNTKLIIVLSSC